MSSIEDRLNELAKRVDALTERFDRFEDKAENKYFDFGLGIKFLEGTVETLERYMHRWNEVYYHVFPDRFDGDLKFERQLSRLNHPPKPGDDDKKR